MTAAMIVLAVLLAVVLLALGLFLFACRRSPVPDFTKPAVIAQWGREDQHFQNPTPNRKLTCYQFENCRNKVKIT